MGNGNFSNATGQGFWFSGLRDYTLSNQASAVLRVRKRREGYLYNPRHLKDGVHSFLGASKQLTSLHRVQKVGIFK